MPRKKREAPPKPNWPPRLNLDPFDDGAPVVIRGVDFLPMDPPEELPKPGVGDDEGEWGDRPRKRWGRP